MSEHLQSVESHDLNLICSRESTRNHPPLARDGRLDPFSGGVSQIGGGSEDVTGKTAAPARGAKRRTAAGLQAEVTAALRVFTVHGLAKATGISTSVLSQLRRGVYGHECSAVLARWHAFQARGQDCPMSAQVRTVGKDGVRLAGRAYVHGCLADIVGKRVLVQQVDDETVYVYSGKPLTLLCAASAGLQLHGVSA